MDEKALEIQSIHTIDGRFPQLPGEAAVTGSALLMLDIPARLGEPFQLSVKTPSGTSIKQYTLCGILKDYPDYSSYTQSNPYSMVPKVVIPTDSEPALIRNVLYGVNLLPYERIDTFGGTANANADAYQEEFNEKLQNEQTKLVTNSLLLFFVILITLGIYDIVKITFQDRRKYIGLLRCIGLTRGQTFRMLMLQGVLLSLCSLAISFPLGIGVLQVMVLVIQAAGGLPVVFSLSVVPFLITAVLCVFVVTLSYGVGMRRFTKRGPLEYTQIQMPKKKRKSMCSMPFSRLWRKASGRGKKGENAISIVLITGCMALLIFGTFVGEYNALSRYYYDVATVQSAGYDYWLGRISGGTHYEALRTEIPRGFGLSPENMEQLRASPNLTVDGALVGINRNAQLLTGPQEQTEAVKRLYQKGTSYLQQGNGKETMKQAGYENGQDLIEQDIFGTSPVFIHAMENNCSDGIFDEQKFLQGEQIIAVGPGFQVGDVVTVTLPVYAKDAAFGNLGTPVIHNFTMTVGAVYRELPENALFFEQVASLGPSALLLSDQLLLNADPEMRYDDVYLSYTGAPNDIQAKKAASELLTQFSFRSGLTLKDYTQLDIAWDSAVKQYKIPTFSIVAMFLLLVFVALSLTISVQLRSSLRSYALLRAVGLDEKQLGTILRAKCLWVCGWGILLGSAIGFILCGLLYSIPPYFPVQNIFLLILLPVTALGALVLIGISILSCFLPKRWILKQSVVSSIQSISY